MDRLHLINVFLAVVDAEGFAGASRKLGISPPAVTRAINELERHLGVQLVRRTTRVVRVTDDGMRYADDCRRILADLAEADAAVTGKHGSPHGKLTVTAPAMFGAKFVTPVVTEYLARYPEVVVSCWFLDRVVNIIDEGVDVAVRIGELPDSTLQAVRVGAVRRVICAAPDYLARRGTPRTPDELTAHCIVSASAVTSTPDWHLAADGKPHTVRVSPRLFTTTNDAAVAAVSGGFGLASLLSYQIDEPLRAGRLRTVLDDYEPPALPVHLVHREGRHASQKARAFLDLAIDRLRAALSSR